MNKIIISEKIKRFGIKYHIEKYLEVKKYKYIKY